MRLLIKTDGVTFALVVPAGSTMNMKELTKLADAKLAKIIEQQQHGTYYYSCVHPARLARATFHVFIRSSHCTKMNKVVQTRTPDHDVCRYDAGRRSKRGRKKNNPIRTCIWSFD